MLFQKECSPDWWGLEVVFFLAFQYDAAVFLSNGAPGQIPGMIAVNANYTEPGLAAAAPVKPIQPFRTASFANRRPNPDKKLDRHHAGRRRGSMVV